MIATITRQQVGTVERALKIFMKLGLVEPLPSGALYMSNIELLIGQSSTEGERKRLMQYYHQLCIHSDIIHEDKEISLNPLM